MSVKKIWLKFTTAQIEAELQDHLDCLMAEGLTRDQAQKRLGPTEEIIAQCLKEKQLGYFKFYSLVIFSALGIILFLVKIFSKSALLLNSYFSLWLYLWIISLIILLAWKINDLIFQELGRESKLAGLISLSFNLLLTVSLVIFYDLDGLEIIMQNSIILIIFLILGLFLKNSFLLLSRLALLITLLSALSQKQLNLFGQLKCLFVTPDFNPLPQTFITCQQISVLDYTFLPFWLLILASLFIFIYFTFKHPKTLVLVCLFSMIILPALFYDFNNYHRLDLLFYQPKIIKIYRQTLNRDPQAKDLEFYASHETYLHLDRIEKSLEDSSEYQQKND